MAEEKRIIDLPEALQLGEQDYLAADNSNLGSRKIPFGRLLSGVIPFPPEYLTGFGLVKTDNAKFSVSSGFARSDDNTRNISLISSFVKDMSLTFGLGNSGCMPSSLTLQPNTTYYVFAVSNSNNLVDVIVDTNQNCVNGLADTIAIANNFDKYVRIGEISVDANSVINRVEPYSLKGTMQDIIDMITAVDNAAMHKTGDENINGLKRFLGSKSVILENESNGSTYLTLRNNSTDYGESAVELVQSTSNNKNQLLLHFQEGNKWCTQWDQDPTSKGISVSFTQCTAVYVPNPTTSDNNQKTATTSFVKNLHQKVNVLPASPDSNVFYYIPE